MSALQDKVALVTGSSRGIGAAIARLFGEQGAKVAVHGRDADALSSVRTDIERSGGRAISVVADVTRFGEIEAMRGEIEGALGPIDILVANAGGSHTPPGPIEQTTEEGWWASIDGNLNATFLTIKSVLPGMKERKSGTIITMSSAAARRPDPGSPIPYAVAKAGVQMLTQDVAAQAGPYGIRVNCLAPEIILTGRNRQHIPEAKQEELVGQHPIRRLGTPEDVARAAFLLASEEAGWISGVILDVAGGAVMVQEVSAATKVGRAWAPLKTPQPERVGGCACVVRSGLECLRHTPWRSLGTMSQGCSCPGARAAATPWTS
jgi:3-oxoacyl-[acyl-carrier protein] reductase